MPIKKGLKPYERKTDETRHLRPRISILEEIAILTAPKWNAKKKKFMSDMNIAEACEKVGISGETFRQWRVQDPKLQKYFQDVRASRKEMIHSLLEDAALQNVMEGIAGGVKLRPLDKINVSLRYLEKTAGEFNPAQKVDIENKSTSLIIGMSTSEMEQRAMDLALSLGFNLNDRKYGNERNQEGDSGTGEDGEYSTPKLLEEPTVDAEYESESSSDGEGEEC